MRSGPKPTASAPAVLRGVVLQDTPHALVRPRAAIRLLPERTSAAPAPASVAPSQEQAFAEGYRQGAAQTSAQLAEAKAGLQASAEEARSAGFEQGREEGLRHAQEKVAAELEALRSRLEAESQQALQEQLDRLKELMQAVRAQTAQLIAAAEDDLVALSHEAVCRVLGARAATPEVLRDMVQQLLAQHALQNAVQAHVHPDDFAFVTARPVADWSWVADDQVQLGGVRLRSTQGTLDARLEVQLEELRQVLLQVRADRAANGAAGA